MQLTNFCKPLIAALALSFSNISIAKGSDIAYFEARDVAINDQLVAPTDSFGFVPGARHLHPLQLQQYYKALAASSPRVQLIEMGQSYQGWPLLMLAISSEQNIEQLETIRRAHLNGSGDHLILWQGFSVHGNEASGANAAPLYAWWAAGNQSAQHQAMLDDTVILIDPMLNPDGLARFASWVNNHQSKVANNDLLNRDHNEGWPNGRTNHYWFDLNRDWLLAQHPESQARLTQFHRWRPHVLTDFHEMGSHNNYFFQPGVPERQNPNTSDKNFELVSKIGEFHAKALDAAGELYYTKEDFDDFYYGKGSTYPDIHGTIGILFEQGSARGHLVDAGDRDRTFADAVQNQLTTALSTTDASVALKQELVAYQQPYLVNADNQRGSYLVGDSDVSKLTRFTRVLDLHDISWQWLSQDRAYTGNRFKAESAIVIERNQKQRRLVDAIFEVRTQFKDNTFYDVSAYNLALSYGFDYALVPSAAGQAHQTPQQLLAVDEHAMAWVFDIKSADALYYLAQLHQVGVEAKVITKPVTVKTTGGNVRLSAGAIMVARTLQKDVASVVDKLNGLQQERSVKVHSITSGLSISGVDMGSPSVVKLMAPKIAIVVGEGVSTYRSGEVWHYIDQRLQYPATLLDTLDVEQGLKSDYSHIVLAPGSHRWLGDNQEAVHRFVKQGGTLIAMGGAVDKLGKWYTDYTVSDKEKSETKAKQLSERKSYSSYDRDAADLSLGGAFLSVDVDTSHPLMFGYDENTYNVFKQRMAMIKPLKNAYSTPVQFADKPLKAGFLGEQNAKKLSGAAALTAQRVGKGLVVAFAFDPLFRATMAGTEPMVGNALLLNAAVSSTNLN